MFSMIRRKNINNKWQIIIEQMREGAGIFKLIFNEHKKPQDYKVIRVNPIFEELFYWAKLPLEGQNVSALMDTFPPPHLNVFTDVVSTNETYHFETILQKTGKELSIKAFPVGGVCFGVVFSDITKSKEVEVELQLHKAHFEQLFRNSPEGMVLLDNGDRIINVNDGFRRLFGFTKNEVVNRAINDVIVPRDLYREGSFLSEKVLNGISVQTEGVRLHKDGRLIDVAITGFPVVFSEKQVSIIGIYRDISKRKDAEAKVRHLSFHDSLTGLYNRAFFEEMLTQMNKKESLPVSVIVADVNGLKLVNDTYGHQKGDDLLKKIAEIFKIVCRQDDIIVRWGGDEFAALLKRTDKHVAAMLANRIKKIAAGTIFCSMPISLALGVATKTDAKEKIDKAITKAEEDMYRKKLLESKSARSAMILSLEKALFEKSYETEEHTRRLKDMARKVGKAFGLSDSQLNDLAVLAALHDIGKIAIPEEIIKKPGPLTPSEWEQVKKHSEIGYRIAKSSTELSTIPLGILHHHERWDGAGYPHGLKGEDIPLIARVISVVDAFDVMTHDRPYKKAVSQEEAIAELKRCSGSQFDPQVVEMFIKIIEE